MRLRNTTKDEHEFGLRSHSALLGTVSPARIAVLFLSPKAGLINIHPIIFVLSSVFIVKQFYGKALTTAGSVIYVYSLDT